MSSKKKTPAATLPAEDGMKVAQQMRLAWIETVIIKNGENGICREDIKEAWKISLPQAGADIKEYIRLTGNDGRLEYNSTARRYVWTGSERTALMDRTAILPLCERIIAPVYGPRG